MIAKNAPRPSSSDFKEWGLTCFVLLSAASVTGVGLWLAEVFAWGNP